MAAEIPSDPKLMEKEDIDALDALASEAKEFEKVNPLPLPRLAKDTNDHS